jgi:hypothetical protein
VPVTVCSHLSDHSYKNTEPHVSVTEASTFSSVSYEIYTYIWHRISNKVWRLMSNPCNKKDTSDIKAICYAHTLNIGVTSFMLPTYWFETSSICLPDWVDDCRNRDAVKNGVTTPQNLRAYDDRNKGVKLRAVIYILMALLLARTETRLLQVWKETEKRSKGLIYISNPSVSKSSHAH